MRRPFSLTFFAVCAEEGRKWIRRTRELTSKPFGVNLTILPSMGEPPPYEEYAKVIVEEGVKIVETAGHKACLACALQ